MQHHDIIRQIADQHAREMRAEARAARRARKARVSKNNGR
jgi:hypothetical protein